MNAKGLDQWILFDRNDYLELFKALDKRGGVRYWLGDVSADGNFEFYRSVKELDADVHVGISPGGQWGYPNIGIEFEPYEQIPKVGVNSGFMLKFHRAGIPVLSLGGEFEKTGEIVSGRLVFSIRFEFDGVWHDFYNKLTNYEAILNLAEELGAVRKEKYLIGPSAWGAYLTGARLVLQTGGSPFHFRI